MIAAKDKKKDKKKDKDSRSKIMCLSMHVEIALETLK